MHGLWIFHRIPRSNAELLPIFQGFPPRTGEYLPAMADGMMNSWEKGISRMGASGFPQENKPGNSFLLAFEEPVLHISRISLLSYES
ncbi:hypothetical protein [Akkermansia sp.]|jgi:hypothetical protein|uniref:hypothetical protein n=2 Tax=Akkermansia TaxID=239934 RepID=UPI00082BB44F